ncbi:MAG: hypothetical protein ACRELZ_06495 [Candidatus Rokuibacteriota bacterium]
MATRAQWDQDSKVCLRAAFTVAAGGSRHASYVECMTAKSYRADVGELAGEISPRSSTPSESGPASNPAPLPAARSATAATPASPSAGSGALKWPPVGARYVQSVRKSGSFGSSEETRTITYLGERTWQGNKVRAFSEGSSTTYVDAQRRMLARVNRSGAPIESYEPYFTLADWPLRIGKWWPNRYRYSDHEWGRSFNNAQYDGEVEAYENVRTRAGTFRSFRIALGGPSGKTVAWYAEALGLVVKTRTERFSNHYRGHGVIETELISYDFKP